MPNLENLLTPKGLSNSIKFKKLWNLMQKMLLTMVNVWIHLEKVNNFVMLKVLVVYYVLT